MPLPIDQVIVPVTEEEVEASILSICSSLGLAVTAWQPGGVIRTFIKACARDIAARTLVDAEIAKGGLGDLASGEWVKIWAEAIYGVLYIQSQAATGDVQAVNASATPHTLNPGDLIIAHPTTGKTYRNIAIVTIAASATTTPIAIAADEVGTISDAAAGLTFDIASPSMDGVTITNPDGPILGADEETAVALVGRARAKLASLSPLGPKEAYNYVAQTPEYSATASPITRSKTTADPDTGEVIVYIATAGGTPSGPDVAIVQAAFDTWAEPWCVTALAVAATEVSIPFTYQVWIRSSLTSLQIQTAIQLALTIYLASVPVGGVEIPPDNGRVYLETLTHVIHQSLPGIERVAVTVPAADVVLADNEVAVLGSLNPTITPL